MSRKSRNQRVENCNMYVNSAECM